MPDFVIQTIQSVTDRIRYFTVCHPDAEPLPEYAAGAHIKVTTADQSQRAYSLIDFIPLDKPAIAYRFAVQHELEGQGGSQFMHQLNVGDTVQCTAPINSFSLLDDERPVLLLAGGIGITPLISMATELHHTGRRFDLHYSSRSAEAMAFRNELTHHFGENVHVYYDDISEKKLNLATLFSECTTQEQVYICGPKGMIDAARTHAEQAGIPAAQVHVELFDTPLSDDADESFEIELSSTGQVHLVPANKTIIDVLEEAGIDTMYDCQRGDCGICETTVIEGEIDHRDVVLSSAEKASGKVMQICVSRARSPRLVLDL